MFLKETAISQGAKEAIIWKSDEDLPQLWAVIGGFKSLLGFYTLLHSI